MRTTGYFRVLDGFPMLAASLTLPPLSLVADAPEKFIIKGCPADATPTGKEPNRRSSVNG
jgi:hypothetical protein